MPRVKNILLHPSAEWQRIGAQRSELKTILTRFVIPMALIPALASFIGYGFVGANGVLFRVIGLYWGTAMAIDSFITSLTVFCLGTVIIDRMSPAFGAAKDMGRSAQLVAFSYTPAWLAGIFYLMPSLQELVVLGLYSVYLFYQGSPGRQRRPDDQRI